MIGGWERTRPMTINLDEEIQKAVKDMDDAEDALAATGFSVEQWMLIKAYVLSAIVHNQCHVANEWQEKISSNLQGSSES